MSAFLASTSRSASPATTVVGGADPSLSETGHRRKRSLPLVEHRSLVQRALGEAGALSEIASYLCVREILAVSVTAKWLSVARKTLRTISLRGKLPGLRECDEEALGRLLVALQGVEEVDLLCPLQPSSLTAVLSAACCTRTLRVLTLRELAVYSPADHGRAILTALCAPSASSPACCLEDLRLGATGLGPEGSATLFNGLAAAVTAAPSEEGADILPPVVTTQRHVGPLDRLRRLHLPSLHLGSVGVTALARAIEAGALPNLQHLVREGSQQATDLSDNSLEESAALDLLLAALSHTRLRVLLLGYNHLAADVGLEALTRLPTLHTLDLERNALGDAAASRLADIISQGGLPELTGLFVAGNGITAVGARALWEAGRGRDEDKGSSLTIDLRFNPGYSVLPLGGAVEGALPW